MFSIDDEATDPNVKYVPKVFLQKEPLTAALGKGTSLQVVPSTLVGCKLHQKRVFGEKWVDRVLGFDGDILYVYQRKNGCFVIRSVWRLSRLLNIRIKKTQLSRITLEFANKSLNPLDDFKVRLVDVELHELFMDLLRKQLATLEIGFALQR